MRQPAPAGDLDIKVVERGPLLLFSNGDDYIREDIKGHVRRGTRRYPMEAPSGDTWQRTALAWLRDHVSQNIPRWYYNVVLGHPLHISTWGALQARVFRPNERDPFHPRREGWWENLGVISLGKVTVAFRDFEIDSLQTVSALYDDFSFHEVGTSGNAEANSQTALIATSGIARQDDASPTEPADNQYKTVATITADATEGWQEHGLFNASTSGTMMDRSTFTSISVNSNDQVQFTYTLTKNAEA